MQPNLPTEKVKTKVRFTSLDVVAIVSNLQFLVGLRATNIYDVNPSTYILKFSKSEQKYHLLIENGVRLHTTAEKPDKKNIPSGFTMKFRKFLRSKRLESVKQVGVERVIVFTFGTESFTNHLILELYSQGNIILTDSNYRILQCIRSHQFNEKVKTAVGQIYPFEFAANLYLENIDLSEENYRKQFAENQKGQGQPVETKKKGKKQKGGVKLKDVIFKLIPCLFPLAIEHILLSKQINPDQKVDIESKEKALKGADICLNFLKQFIKSDHKGYLYLKIAKEETVDPEYFEFSPFNNVKYRDIYTSKNYSTFNEATEEYFSKYKKSAHQQEQQFQEITWKKYDQIKRDQDERVKKLQQQQDIYKLKAEYIQRNVEDVDAVIKIIKTMEDNGYSWEAIEKMVFDSKKNGDPLANMIHSLNILKRQVTVLLGDPGSENQLFSLVPVQINIDYNAFTNATLYYESKKKNYLKEQRTKQASEQVLKIAQKDALKKIQKKKNQILYKSIPQRKMFWFEKFYWFVTSEGYLVISGRDSHQNELLVKRYMKSGDLYMHSDYGGAASTIIKRHEKGIPVPRNSLEEAGIFTVCRSKAWDTKIISSAWWVYDDQVSKSAPTGQFLPTGSFMIRGKRNFVHPNRMEMGLTFLYKIDQQSVQRHLNDRKIHDQEQQLIKQDQLRKVESKQKEEQQYAIINIEAESNKAKNQKKNNQNKALKDAPTIKKQASNQPQQKQPEDKDQIDSDEEQDEDSENEKVFDKNKKNENIKKKDAGKEIKNQGQTQQKHKNRNKKKMKKLQKYLEEQDEDERQIIMKMLGAKEMKHMKGSDEQDDVDKKQLKKKKNEKKKKGIQKYINFESNDLNDQKINPDKVLFLKQKKESSSESQQEIEIKQLVEQEEQKDKQNPQIEPQGDNANDAADSDGDEPIEQGKEENKKQEQQQVDEKVLQSELSELLKLVGKVHHLDKYECFVPMCAPYQSIKQNRFKVKLVPGGLKKGKAARSILGYFSSMPDLTQVQKPFLKALPEQQIINSIIGNVKLAGAGLLKLQMKSKADKKVKRKEQDKKVE